MIRPRPRYVTIAVLAGLSLPALATAESGGVIAAEPSVELAPETSTETPPARARSRLPAGLVVGGGLASLGTGLVVIAVGQKEDPDEKFRYSFPRAYLGTGLAVAGAAAIGIGVAMWVRGSESTSAPTVSVTKGGGVVGWARTF